MAWGSHNQVFLGEDLMQTRDYSDETARVIDDRRSSGSSVSSMNRCREVLVEYRHGLDLVARALLEHETISGAEVERLIEVSRTPGVSVDEVVAAGAEPAEVGSGDDG